MAKEGKKISFGFSKSIKKPDLKPISQTEIKKVDYIEYVDDKSIKVIGKEEAKDEPLVIPMLGSKSWHDRIINKINADIYGTHSLKNGNVKSTDVNKKLTNFDSIHDSSNTSTIAKKIQKHDKQKKDKSQTCNSAVSLEDLAAQEIIKDLHENDNEEEECTTDLTIEQSNNLVGEREPTLENYEEIPIDKFGVALLRGMGWEPEKGIGKNSKVVPVTVPNLRPRGMGLGADKVILQKQNIQPKTKEEKELVLKKGCYVRIMAGKYSNNYGQLESFDDESGRLIVKLALGNKCVSLNEYLIEPVTKENYMKNSKVLNISTYEKFNNKTRSNSSSDSPELDEKSRTEERYLQNDRSSSKKISRSHDKSDISDESSDSNGTHRHKNDYHKSKKLKIHRQHNDSYLNRKSKKKDKEREKTKDRSRSHHSSNKSSDKKKHKKHKSSRSTSLNRQ